MPNKMCLNSRLYRFLFSAAITLAALTACSDKHSAVSEFRDIAPSGWVYGSDLIFTPSGLDSIKERSLLLTVRHSNAYVYRNIWVEVTTRTLDHKRVDTLNIELADIYGRWHGTGFGPSYQYELPVGQPMLIGDTSRIAVRHIMRVDTLRGVEQIGITITPPHI